jgi:hypothetical protein
MVESRWLRWVGPGVVALGAVGFISSTTLGAGVRPWVPNGCAGSPPDLVAAARDRQPAVPAELRGTPWYRLDPILDREGALSGQHLTIGLDGDRTARTLDLAREAFTAGPFGAVVLVGSDDGTRSHLQALDVASGCAWSIADEHDVIRRATIDPTGSFIYEMRVDRATRADLGIWRRSVAGTEAIQRVLDGLPADERFGRTFSTEFTWDVAGDRLAVQSCGELSCRMRVFSPGGDPVVMLDSPGLGTIVGLDGDRAVTYEACRGLPCPILSTDLGTGDRQVLAAASGLAVVIPTTEGARLVHETGGGSNRSLRSVAVDGTGSRELGTLPDGLRLQPSGTRADAGTDLPVGWVLLAPDGRLPASPTDDRSELRRVTDGLTVPLDEALR